MSGASSIKISDEVKNSLKHLKIHPRETYSDVIGRLVPQEQGGITQGHIPLMYVKIHGEIREVKNPIDLSVEFEDGDYIIYNNDFHLLVVAPDLKEAMQEINYELAANWEDYVERDAGDLTKGALEFRENLRGLFE